MVERARVVIVDDQEPIREGLKMILGSQGHEVIGEAGDMTGATDLIDKLEQGEVDAVFLDGNLTPGEHDSREGATLANLVRDKFGGRVAIIGISGTEPIRGEDVINVGKPFLPSEVSGLIQGLPENHQVLEEDREGSFA